MLCIAKTLDVVRDLPFAANQERRTTAFVNMNARPGTGQTRADQDQVVLASNDFIHNCLIVLSGDEPPPGGVEPLTTVVL